MSEFKNAVLHSVLLVCFASGCSSSDGVGVVAGVDTMPASDMADASSDTDVSQAVPWEPGEYAASHVTVEYYDTGRDRSLTVEVWFPGTEPPASPEPTETFEAETTARQRVLGLLEAAPIGCPTRFTKGVRGGEYLDGLGARPLAVFSHCLNCGRYSSFSLAERLVSHGFIVVSADHAGPIPFVEEANSESLSPEQLEVRANDVSVLIDAALSGDLFEQHPALNTIAIDPERIGVYGHSFGAVTAGKAALSDPRIRAVAGLAAPLANPLFPGVEMKDISVPVLLVLAEEDNSILEFGNDFIRQGFEAANTPAWLVSIADAGHWSISDVCGLTSAFSAGCGEGIRHSKGNEGQSFTYLSSVEGIAIAQRHLTTFMLRFVSMTITAEAAQLPPEPGVEVRVR